MIYFRRSMELLARLELCHPRRPPGRCDHRRGDASSFRLGRPAASASSSTIGLNPLASYSNPEGIGMNVLGRLVAFAAIAMAMFVSVAAEEGDLAPLTVEKPDLKFGFIKLTDCAPIVIAKEKGFFKEEGLNVEVLAQPNWTQLLNNVISGELDGAHMLSGQPLAATIGVNGDAHIITPFTMDLNGNGITVSNAIWARMQEEVPELDTDTPEHPISAAGLRPIVDEYIADGKSCKWVWCSLCPPTTTKSATGWLPLAFTQVCTPKPTKLV